MADNGFSNSLLQQVRSSLKHISEIRGIDQQLVAPIANHGQQLHDKVHEVQSGMCQHLLVTNTTLDAQSSAQLRAMLIAPKSNVKEVELVRCGINAQVSGLLCEGVSGPFGSFRSVTLEGNTGITSACVEKFVSKSLEVLRVRDCGLGDEAVKSVVDALQTQHSQLYELDFKGTTLMAAHRA